jgi:hypothetical protein
LQRFARLMSTFDNAQIAARIRNLLRGEGEYGAIAARLGIHETALRMSVDELSPYPTMDVIAAVVRAYAVDPSWLLTGDYDSGSHRSAIQASTAELPAIVKNLVEQSGTPTPPYNLRINRR